MLVLLLHVAEALDDLLQLVAAVRVRHGVLEVHQLVVEVPQAAAAGDGLVQHGAARHLVHFLPEVADGELLREAHHAVVGMLLAHDHAEQRGLARAVGPHQPDLLARIELEGRVDEEHLLPVLLADIGKRDHGTSADWLARASEERVRDLPV